MLLRSVNVVTSFLASDRNSSSSRRMIKMSLKALNRRLHLAAFSPAAANSWRRQLPILCSSSSNETPGVTTKSRRIDGVKNLWFGQRSAENGGGGGGPNDSRGDRGRRSYRIQFTLSDLFVAIAVPYFGYKAISNMSQYLNSRVMNWEDFVREFAAKNSVESLTLLSSRSVKVKLKEDEFNSLSDQKQIIIPVISLSDLKADLKDLEKTQNISIPLNLHLSNDFWTMISSLMDSILAVSLLFFIGSKLSRKMITNISPFRNEPSRQTKNDVNVSFRDVAGCNEAKFEIQEFVDFLKFPGKYTKLGAKIPKGVLLSGPPGSGKTLLAKATAGEAKVPFFQVKGSEFMEMFVGVGASRLRKLFADARNASPSIIFIDEIDAIGRKRSDNSSNFGSHREFDNTLNQLLVEMDGFNPSDKKDPIRPENPEHIKNSVIVMAATNIPSVLDSALTRSGRFDRHIEIMLPDKSGRQEIFNVHLSKLCLNKDISKSEYCNRLSDMTTGMSGADIENVCNEGAIAAARNNAESVGLIHLENAIERILCGLERKSLVLSSSDKSRIAYHEAGHALVGHFLKNCNDILKISIIPRGKSLGYTQTKLSENMLQCDEYLSDQMCCLLGGREAEKLKFGNLSSGAADDLDKVTKLAYSFVNSLGMSEAVGPVSYNTNIPYRNISDTMHFKIDEEVSKLLKIAQKKTQDLLLSKTKLLDTLAKCLIDKETLNRDEFVKLVETQ